jgi:hypothetical protein
MYAHGNEIIPDDIAGGAIANDRDCSISGNLSAHAVWLLDASFREFSIS